MHKFKLLKGKIKWVALKLDMKKVYDQLEWNFIQACLQKLGFHSKWNERIMECFTTISYLIIVNDERNGLIRRGIR